MEPFDLAEAKQVWLAAIGEAEAFVRERPPEEDGCLYYASAGRGVRAPGVPDSRYPGPL